jgi:hypothetical protein
MKKLFTIAMGLFFLTATSGLVLAQGTTGTPAAKTVKTHKKRHVKKVKKDAAPVSTPVSK